MLGSAWAQPAPQSPGAPVASPAAGDVIPAFVADRVSGTSEYVDFPKGSTTILIFFSSGCPHCQKMIPEWNRACERKPAGIKVVGVLMDQEPPGFFIAMPVAFPVVRAPGREFLRNIKVNRVPLTLRVGPGGKVEEVGSGELDPIRLGELFRK